MWAPSIVWTIVNGIFTSGTVDIVQPDLTTSSTKVGGLWSTKSARISQLTAYDTRIIHIPDVIAYSSPCTVVEYLYSPLTVPASSDKSHSLCKSRISYNQRLSVVGANRGGIKPLITYHIKHVSQRWSICNWDEGTTRVLTWTNDRCIFMVTAVMWTPSIVRAILNGIFTSCTIDIV